ncbi:MAG: OmpA family protein [Edaphocola sp.]
MVLLVCCTAMAARAQEVSSHAQTLYRRALEYQGKHELDKAEKFFRKSMAADETHMEAYLALGQLYNDQCKYAAAADVFGKAAGACTTCMASFGLQVAQALVRVGDYAKAGQALGAWAAGQKGNAAATSVEYKRLLRNMQFARYALNLPPTDTPVNLGARINTQYDEYFPSISRDDSTLVFTHRTNGVDEDFYEAHRDSCGGWFVARDMGSPPNSTLHEGAQMVSADGHYLFFMRCGNRSENGWDAGGCDLFFSCTEPDGWSVAVPFGGTINSPGFEGMPSLSSDNRVLYFSSDREGGYGGKDIWFSRFQDGLWQVPENVGPEINTDGDETAPVIAADNSTLYFTSNGHAGLGGNDLFLSRKKNQHWSKPENLGYPCNSSCEDVSICVSPDGHKAYFASDRAGGLGAMDLYEVSLSGNNRPRPYTFVYGKVYDSLSLQLLDYAQIEWNDAATGQAVFRFQSNRGDASYDAAIPLNTTYAIHVYRPGYADYFDTVTFAESHIAHPDTLNFSLLTSDYSPPLYDTLLVRFDNYEKNSVGLSDSALKLLKNMVAPYLRQPLAEYYVNGFTDDTGTPFINEELSFGRSRYVAGILRGCGIADEKIHIQGWADANPLYPNDSDEHRRLNRRVEVTVRRP